MSKHSRHSKEQQLFKEQNNNTSKEIPLETYEDIESVTKLIKLKYSKEFSQAFKEQPSKRLNLHEESKENRIKEGIEKYIESDEAIKENKIFVINLQKILL